jgi:UDP-2,3-diacylglucosamine pyrophosphatase LpxH
MGQDRNATHKRLNELWKDQSVKTLPIDRKKYFLVSDLHLGNQEKADDFRKNEQGLIRALDHYFRQGFTLILLGDIEEFWQFDLSDIESKYRKSVYGSMRRFAPNRIVRIYGNHDSEWGVPKDPATDQRSSASPEAVKLTDSGGRARVLLIHGHQGSTESDKYSWFSRFFVRLYRIVEPLIKIDKHPSAPKSQVAGDYERIVHGWASKNNVVVICGHTHRAIFASLSYADRLRLDVEALQWKIREHKGDKRKVKALLKDLEKKWDALRREQAKGRGVTPIGSQGAGHGWYYNTGCGLFTDGITGLEIEGGTIRLVKWSRKPKPGRVVLQPEGNSVKSLI